MPASPGWDTFGCPAAFETEAVGAYAKLAKDVTVADFFLSMIPTSFVEPFVKGDILPILFIAVPLGGAVDMDVGNTELPAGFVETDETRGWDVNNELEMQPAS